MKKFSFRLQSVLKLKEFTESKKKQELGQINKQCQILRDGINKCQENIARVHKEENEVLQSHALSADFLTFYPRYVRAQREKIKQLERELEEQQQLFEEKLSELATARGDVKIFENMREKEQEQFKKELRRKEILNIEEVLNIKRAREKSV